MNSIKLELATGRLASLCGRCFGPCGEETLLFRPADAPVVTGEGHAVLKAWRNSIDKHHPLAKFLLDAAEGLHQQIGDAASGFILLVDAAVRRANECLGGEKTQRNEMDRSQLSKAFGELKWELQSELLGLQARDRRLTVATPIELDCKTLQPSKQFREAAANILTSALNGILGDKAVAFIVELVLKWVFTAPDQFCRSSSAMTSPSKLLFRRIQQFLKRAPEAIIFMAAPSVLTSYVVPRDDFILKKSLVSSQPPGILNQRPIPVRFACLSCSVSLATGSNSIELATSTSEELFTAQDAERIFIATYIHRLRDDLNIQLLISTEALDDNVVAICTRQGIACVQFAEPEDVETLCIQAGILPLASVFDDIHDKNHVGMSKDGVSLVRFQQQACLRFRKLSCPGNQTSDEFRHQNELSVTVPQLLVHAPSKGVYKQYYAAIVKCLRVLRSWWEPDGIDTLQTGSSSQDVAFCCRGGGATELAIARWLQTNHENGASHKTSTMASTSRQVFGDALIDVVATLRGTLNKACSSKSDSNQLEGGRRRLLVEALSSPSLHHHDKKGQTCYGYVLNHSRTVDTVAGPIQIPELVFADPAEFGLLHPWRRIDMLLFLALQTLEQLFRIDKICLSSANTAKPAA